MKTHISNKNRIQYLEGLGIDIWHYRNKTKVPDDTGSKIDDKFLEMLRSEVAACKKCELHKSRTQTVFGIGSQYSELMIIGEAPGADEDRIGEPFVGKAGKLLNEMLFSINLLRKDVFITNILKCRPPKNRDPSNEETELCSKYLNEQINRIKPKLVLALGRVAAQNLLSTTRSIGQLRGHIIQIDKFSIAMVATYHPAYLLRSPKEKSKSWEDLRLVRNFLNNQT